MSEIKQEYREVLMTEKERIQWVMRFLDDRNRLTEQEAELFNLYCRNMVDLETLFAYLE